MKKESLSLAKRLLDRILKKIKPSERYENIIKKYVKQTKRKILRYSSDKNIYGVFGKDEKFQTFSKFCEKGSKLIQKIASSICKNLKKTVITGRRIYYYNKAGKVKREDFVNRNLIDKIKKEDNWGCTYSRILGHIPNHAVFLIDKDRSASIYEEESFHTNITNKFGLGILIPHKKYSLCKHMIEISDKKDIQYHQCTSNDFNKCIKKGSGCVTHKMKINQTTLKPFINKNSHYFIITNNLNNIEKVILNLILVNKIHTK